MPGEEPSCLRYRGHGVRSVAAEGCEPGRRQVPSRAHGLGTSGHGLGAPQAPPPQVATAISSTSSSWRPHSHCSLCLCPSTHAGIQASLSHRVHNPSPPVCTGPHCLCLVSRGHSYLDRTTLFSLGSLTSALPVPMQPPLLSQFPLAGPLSPASDLLQSSAACWPAPPPAVSFLLRCHCHAPVHPAASGFRGFISRCPHGCSFCSPYLRPPGQLLGTL